MLSRNAGDRLRELLSISDEDLAQVGATREMRTLSEAVKVRVLSVTGTESSYNGSSSEEPS
jgi:hypothetical protein